MKRLLFLLVIILGQAHGGIAIKNFREFYESLQVSTGIGASQNFVKAFTAVKEQLPQSGLPSEMNASAQMGMLALSSTACDEMITSDSKLDVDKRWVHRQIDFSKTADQLLMEPANSVFEEYAGIFWQRNPTVGEKSFYQEMVKELLANPSDLKESLLLLCTIAATGPDFFIF